MQITNVTLEADIIDSWEYEGIGWQHKRSSFGILLPNTEDGRFGRASVHVRQVARENVRDMRIFRKAAAGGGVYFLIL